jgi:hypothetical protein
MRMDNNHQAAERLSNAPGRLPSLRNSQISTQKILAEWSLMGLKLLAWVSNVFLDESSNRSYAFAHRFEEGRFVGKEEEVTLS